MYSVIESGTLPLSGSAYFLIFSATSWASISSNPTISLLHDGAGSYFNQKLIAALLHSIIKNCCCVSISSNFARGILIPQELLHSSFHFSIPSIALSTLSGDRTGEEALPEWWEWTPSHKVLSIGHTDPWSLCPWTQWSPRSQSHRTQWLGVTVSWTQWSPRSQSPRTQRPPVTVSLDSVISSVTKS